MHRQYPDLAGARGAVGVAALLLALLRQLAQVGLVAPRLVVHRPHQRLEARPVAQQQRCQ